LYVVVAPREVVERKGKERKRNERGGL